jgi:transposase
MNEAMCTLYDLEGVEIENISVEEGKIEVFGRLQDERQECSTCGSNEVIFIGKSTRHFHLPPTGSKKAILSILHRRNQCKECKSTWWPQVPFADGKQRMTKTFVRYALELLQFGTIKDVAVHLGVSWDVIKDLHKHYLKDKYANISLENVTYISIDEFSIAKGHKYMTVISDLRSGQILHAVEGRKKSDIEPFLKVLKKKQKNYVL